MRPDLRRHTVGFGPHQAEINDVHAHDLRIKHLEIRVQGLEDTTIQLIKALREAINDKEPKK